MRMSESVDQIATALAEAQKSIKNPEKNREVTVRSDKGSYKFRYATLDCILDTVREPLTTNGLWFTHTLDEGDGGKFRLVTTLLHKSGQWIASEQPLFVEKAGSNQAFGSALSYAKRYAVMGLFALSADEDDDANHADGNTVQSSTERDRASQAATPANRPTTTTPKAQPPQQPATAPEPANGKRAIDWPSVQARNVPKDLMAETLASGMSECIRMAEDAGELAQLEQENKTALDWLAKAVPAGHAQIKRQIAARLDEIANGPNAMAGI